MLKRMSLLAVVAALVLGAGGCTRYESTYIKKVNEAEDLRRELAELTKKHTDLKAENAKLKFTVEKLTADLAGMTSRRDKVALELDDMTSQRDRLVSDNKQLDGLLKAKSDSLSQTVVEFRKKVADLETENGNLKKEIAGLKKAVEERDGKVAALEGEKARLSRDIALLKKAEAEKVEKVSKTYENLLEKMKGEIAQGQVTISELKGKLTVNMVDAILFDSGKAEVKTEGMEVLQKVISILKDVRDKAIRTEGHTDNVQIGGALAKKYPTNWELSAARAINVTRFLQEQGLDPAVLAAVAYGEYKPVADNGTPEGRAKNRRIEIILVPRE